ncbi:MAG: calcineurin-like phosphoesterase [Haloquadratum sp. J07HQX50]|nr:MAG: calcineurin-like phosphoesterase [Haloquadratum sp. J07HQX50]
MNFDPGATPESVEWFRARGESPAIVSLSDVHGYLSAARNALTAVGETDEYPPVVRSDEDGLLHWAGNDYILIVNGDLIDRGDENRACLNLLERLVKEAPDGRVRYHLGNHEMAVLFPERFQWPGVYSIKMNESLRESFIRHVADGSIAVAFEGYRYTYSHAGDNEYFEVGRANRQASEASNQLLTMLQEARYRADQLDILSEYQLVFGVGGGFGRGPSAGLLWMDFEHVQQDAPPQVVGHSRQQRPTRTGQVLCQNVIRSNLDSSGGEAVLIEHPNKIVAVRNTPTDAVVTEI